MPAQPAVIYLLLYFRDTLGMHQKFNLNSSKFNLCLQKFISCGCIIHYELFLLYLFLDLSKVPDSYLKVITSTLYELNVHR